MDQPIKHPATLEKIADTITSSEEGIKRNIDKSPRIANFLLGYEYAQKEFANAMKPMMTCMKLDIPNAPDFVPMELLSEQWAKNNHGQTLEKLNSRGGLSVGEMLANIHRRSWRRGDDSPEGVAELNHILATHHDKTTKNSLRKELLGRCKLGLEVLKTMLGKAGLDLGVKKADELINEIDEAV